MRNSSQGMSLTGSHSLCHVDLHVACAHVPAVILEGLQSTVYHPEPATLVHML